jgi:hypothetical protein
MARIVEFLVALNAIGGVLTFLGIRWGVRKARGRLPGGTKTPPNEIGE